MERALARQRTKARSQKWVVGLRSGNRQNGASYANDDVTQYYPPGQGAIDNASAQIGLVLRPTVHIVPRPLRAPCSARFVTLM